MPTISEPGDGVPTEPYTLPNGIPATFTLRFQRSSGGVTEADFHDIGTLANVTPGDPFTFNDDTVTASTLYLYRVRYECDQDATCVSDWAYLYARAPSIESVLRGIHMGNVITAAMTQTAIGVERVKGQQVQAAYGLGTMEFDFAPEVNNADINEHHYTVGATTDQTRAGTPLTGTMRFAMRPNGATLRAMLAAYTLNPADTQTIGAAAPAPQYYIHKLLPGFTNNPITIVRKEGPYGFVHAGCDVNTLGIEFDASANVTTPLQVQMAMNYLNYSVYDAASNADLVRLGLSAVTYDVEKLGQRDWALLINSAISPDAQKVGFNFNRNLATKMVGNYLIGGTDNYADVSAVGLTATLYFTDLAQLLQFYGLPANQVLPFGITKTILVTEVRIRIKPPLNSSSFSQQIDIVFPVCSVNALTKPVGQSGAIMQNITFKPRQDPANNYADHYILWTTAETAAAIIAPQPEIEITPKTDFYGYNNVYGVVSNVTSASQFASSANAYLSATNSVYSAAGCTIQFISGALAGQVRTCSAYVGASRTFTVGAAFGSAPTIGDKFIVIGGFGL